MKKPKHVAGLLTAALLAVFLTVVPAGKTLAEQTGTVRGGWLILRNMPSYDGAEISSYPTGTVVTITGKSGSWYAVTAPDGLTGYMLGKYLKVNGSGIAEGSQAWVTSRNGLRVRLRSGPGTQYAVLAAYMPGTACTVLGEDGDYSKIQVGTLTGYMMSKYLTTTQGSDSGKETSGSTGSWKEGDALWVNSSNGKGVNLRSGPSKAYNSIGFYSVGTKGKMLVPGNPWSYIQIGDVSGYMMTSFLKNSEPSNPSPVTKTGYVVSPNGKYVNLRTGPGTGYDALYAYAPGTKVTILSQSGDWSFVQVQKTYGYMMTQFIHEK